MMHETSWKRRQMLSINWQLPIRFRFEISHEKCLNFENFNYRSKKRAANVTSREFLERKNSEIMTLITKRFVQSRTDASEKMFLHLIVM